jgi:hypothetical protein
MKKTGARHLFLFAVMLLLPAAAFAQTAERLDAILDAQELSFGQAALIILPAAGLLPPGATMAEAFAMARPCFPRWAREDDPIIMKELAYLVTRSFKLSGGFLYALFPGPRYGYRVLAWRRFLPPQADPARRVKGEELLYITGRALSFQGEEPSGLDIRMDVQPGTGLSSGPEDILPYEGEFEVE